MHWFAETREDYCPRWFRAMAQTFPDRWHTLEIEGSTSAVLVKSVPTPDRVAVIISGGGSNGPFIPGFVGEGMADAAVVGPPYTAPSAYALYEAGKMLGKEKGILLLYNNFMGDYLNNDMAAELLQLDGYTVEQVTCYDDMGMAIGEPRENRGGRIAIAYLIKLCAEAALQGKPLEEISRLARKAISRSVTLCVTVEPEKDLVTYGTGFSDEPGFLIREAATIAGTAEETVRLLYEDVQPQPDELVYMLVNRMRMTSYSDSFVMAGCLKAALDSRVNGAQMSVGGYMQVMDRYGYTVTLLCADKEIAPYLEGTLCGDGFLL